MSGWPMVALGEVLTKSQDLVTVHPDRLYKEVTVRLWGKGAVLRREVTGAEIAAKARVQVHAEQFIISRIDARNGASGLIPPELEGAIVSNDFPVFSPVTSRLVPAFFGWLSKTQHFIDLCRAASEGTTNRVRLKEDRFLKTEIPLPRLDEQRRIVERIDALAARIEEAKRLREELRDVSLPAFVGGVARKVFAGEMRSPASRPSSETQGELPPVGTDEQAYVIPSSWRWVRLGDACHLITDRTHLTPQYVEVGQPFLSAQNVKPFRFMPENHRNVSDADFATLTARVIPEAGDVLMTRVGAKIGEAALIDRDIEFAFYVSLCLIRPNEEIIHGPYLVHWLNSPFGVAKAREKTLGRGHSQGNLNLNLIRRFPVPIPPLDEQRAIVEYLESVRLRIELARKTQEETAAQLDALLTAILDRAFKGELAVDEALTRALDEDDVLIECALRLDGYAFEKVARRRLGDLVGIALEDVSRLSLNQRFAAFFMMQRHLYKWGGESLPRNHHEWKVFRELFLELAPLDVPAKYAHAEFMASWRRKYGARVEEAVAFVRRVHEAMEYLPYEPPEI